MGPDEICRRLGETKTKAIFHELTSDGMKKVMHEANLSTTRLASHTSLKKRNADWAAMVWRLLVEQPKEGPAAMLLFEWLSRTRRPMLAEFLTGIGVAHQNGLTDEDFMKAAPPEKMVEVAQALLEHHDRQEAAAYLIFLDATNKSETFAALGLEKFLAPAASAAAAEGAPQT